MTTLPSLATVTFEALLWLAALDPDPYPRCVEVRKSDLARFPPEKVCDKERGFWNNRENQVRKHMDNGVSPWGYELALEHARAGRTAGAWLHLREAHQWARYGSDDDQICRHLETYKAMVGDGPYVAGWYPARMTP